MTSNDDFSSPDPNVLTVTSLSCRCKSSFSRTRRAFSSSRWSSLVWWLTSAKYSSSERHSGCSLLRHLVTPCFEAMWRPMLPLERKRWHRLQRIWGLFLPLPLQVSRCRLSTHLLHFSQNVHAYMWMFKTARVAYRCLHFGQTCLHFSFMCPFTPFAFLLGRPCFLGVGSWSAPSGSSLTAAFCPISS